MKCIMTRNEFRQKALISIAAALVKVMDEQVNGIINNDAAHDTLVQNAEDIAFKLDCIAEADDLFLDEE